MIGSQKVAIHPRHIIPRQFGSQVKFGQGRLEAIEVTDADAVSHPKVSLEDDAFPWAVSQAL